MDMIWICLGWALLVIGFVGCFVPVLPGPTIAYCALLSALAIGDHAAPSVTVLVGAGLLTAMVTVLDYIVPAWGAAKFNCSRWGTVGCFVGTIAGLFFLPLGVLAGPFLGAFLGEIVSGKAFAASLRGAAGALLGFLAGVAMKVVCCGVLTFYFWLSVV